MIRHKWLVGVRNKLANIAMEMDSAAAIEGARMTTREREHFQQELRKLYGEIDKAIF